MESGERQALFAALKERHIEVDGIGSSHECGYDYEIWPCDTAVLLKELESIQALLPAIEKANEVLDWIEKRDGPLPNGGYARIETTVAVVRAFGMRLAQVEKRDHAASRSLLRHDETYGPTG